MLTYENYVQKIRHFQRDELLASCATMAWQSWDIEDKGGYSDKEKIQILSARAFSPRIFSIAAATGNNHRSSVASTKDFFDLSNLFLEVKDAVSDNDFVKEEYQIIETLWKEAEYLSNFNFDSGVVGFSTKALFLQRSLRAQWDNKAYSFRHIMRSWIIINHLNRRLGERVLPAIGSLFSMDPVDAFRSACGIYFLACGKDKFTGIYDIEKSSCQKEITDTYKMDLETINLMSNRVSMEIGEFRTWHDEEVLPLHEYYRKYAPLPLYRTPLLKAQEIWEAKDPGVSERTYLCPSPHILMHTLSDMFALSLRENTTYLEGVNVLSEFGYAVEDYLEKDVLPLFFDSNKIQRLNAGDGNSKIADFLVETEEAWFVIESKRSFSGSLVRSICDPPGILSTWNRMLESYIQCSNTAKTISDKSKPVISIVVVSDDILGEQGVFDMIAFHSGILKELGLEYIEVMSLDSFERCFQFGSIKDVVESIKEKWKVTNEAPNIGNFHSLQVKKRGEREPVSLEYLSKCFDEVFPHLDNVL